jgi:two-component system response regulator PilR (NtrC family)
MQVKLLRAIQEKAIKPVGALEEVSVDIRILCATHKSLEIEVANGRFRQDLYYRLNVIKLDVPPLRVRENDLLLLVDFFLKKISHRWEVPLMELSSVAKSSLQHYSFPGNVRELENILERAITLCDSTVIQPDDLQLPKTPPTLVNQLPEVITTARVEIREVPMRTTVHSHLIPTGEEGKTEQERILHALEQTRWNRTRAAILLNMTFRQLRYRIQKYNLDPKKYRTPTTLNK